MSTWSRLHASSMPEGACWHFWQNLATFLRFLTKNEYGRKFLLQVSRTNRKPDAWECSRAPWPHCKSFSHESLQIEKRHCCADGCCLKHYAIHLKVSCIISMQELFSCIICHVTRHFELQLLKLLVRSINFYL